MLSLGLLGPQLAVKMLKAARAKARGRALKQRNILNSPRVGLVVSKKDFSSLGHRVIGSAMAFTSKSRWLDAPDIPITIHRA
jgi:RNase P protein component